MEYHGTGLPARRRHPGSSGPSSAPKSSEPSWTTVIATTLRLWFERHPVLSRRAPRRRRLAALIAVLAVVIAGSVGAASAVLTQGSVTPAVRSSAAGPSGGSSSSSSGSGLGASAEVRAETATWIAAQIAPSAIVACDPAMCAALEADRMPTTSLTVLGAAAVDPLGSDLVVATAAVRAEFGQRLAGVYAPELIASFGSGTERIDVRAIAADGAKAYRSSLSADLGSRVAAARQLLGNPQLTVAAGARSALAAGDVDSRLLTLLAGLAAEQPVTVLAFGDKSPGADSSVPLRSVQVAPRISPAKAGTRLRAMRSFVQAQQQPYLPLRTSTAGSSLTVEYAAPSPLGLLSGP
jgi:hypothetical protein